MDLTAALWITVTAIALILAGDAFMTRVLHDDRMTATTRRSTLRFGVLMFLFALACGGVSLFEVLT